ncbi:MAG: hypothetical protein QG608_219 [Actinomycetota bacterium]|nr:hypothetical protein [Actinomycetota bacterium]
MSSLTDPAWPGPDESSALEILRWGDLTVLGRLVDASNATLLARAALDDVETYCVYKPISGERPLWDFPRRTLAHREVAAYVLSVATGWDLVPPTVLRDGPFGPGSVQWWVRERPEDTHDVEHGPRIPAMAEPGGGLVDVLDEREVPAGWLHVLDAEDLDGAPVVLAHADDAGLRRMAVFDVVANNADRKGGHVLRDSTGCVFGVDHGLTFNVEDKMRTVLWGWSGDPLPAEVCGVLAALGTDLQADSSLHRELSAVLSPDEVGRTARRAESLLASGRHPGPLPDRPSLPWPAF